VRAFVYYVCVFGLCVCGMFCVLCVIVFKVCACVCCVLCGCVVCV